MSDTETKTEVKTKTRVKKQELFLVEVIQVVDGADVVIPNAKIKTVYKGFDGTEAIKHMAMNKNLILVD
jgi:hypothetical protein